ncbi:MAG: hypothetical protein JNK32_12255 [Anaerolineales bacterium]|nr:hypothetical protein [Anaerolineales bacterium]
MKIDLGKILTRSWQIIWNNKVLWIFGILAGFASGNGGGNNGSNSSNNDPSNSFPGGMEQFTEQAGEFFQQYMLIIIAVCLVIVVLSFLFYALGMMGRIGLLKGVYKVEQGVTALQFGELWSESMPYFWRFFGLNFLVGLAFLVILLPFIAIAIATMGVGLACLLPMICLLVPIAWVVNVILEQGQAAIVAEDLTITEGFRRGWEIAKSDIGGMIVLSLVLGIGSAIIGFIMALPLIAAMLPFIFSMMSYESGAPFPPTAWISIVCCVAYFPVLLVLNGILTSYMKTAWALSYLQLTKPAENTPVVVQVNA